MASLQARHSRTCGHGKPWTPFGLPDTCTCEPTYYTVVRNGPRLLRDKVGKNRRTAERMLAKVQVKEDEGNVDELETKNISFSAWADQWIATLEAAGRLKANTIYTYRVAMNYATAEFGTTQVRKLTGEDITNLLNRMARNGASASTRAKHLVPVSACLNAAIKAGYATRNPIEKLADNQRPRRREHGTESAYFTDEETARLFAEFTDRAECYRMLFTLALKTGMRLGELSALTWGDVDLLERVIWVRRTYTDGRITTPKSGKARDVRFPAEVADLLGEWWGELGNPADNTLVLPGATKTGYLNPQVVLRRELYPAMKRAGIPRVGPSGQARTFHSLRHTFARIALENGKGIYWLSKHLGHSSTAITEHVYGHFSTDAKKREAEELAGIFPV